MTAEGAVAAVVAGVTAGGAVLDVLLGGDGATDVVDDGDCVGEWRRATTPARDELECFVVEGDGDRHAMAPKAIGISRTVMRIRGFGIGRFLPWSGR